MLQVIRRNYSFKCSHCGSTNAVIREHKITEYPLISAELNEDKEIGMVATVDESPAANCDRFSHTTVMCQNCRAEWGGLSAALNTGSLHLTHVVSRQTTECTITEEVLPDCANAHPGTGDAVHCNWCDWTGVVVHGESVCPKCGKSGCLQWQEENKQEVEAAHLCYKAPYMIAKFSPACALILTHAMISNPKETTFEGKNIIRWQSDTLAQYIHGKTDTLSFTIRTNQDAVRYTPKRTWMSINVDEDEIYLHCSEENNPQDTPFPECDTIAHAQLSTCPPWIIDQWRKEAVDFDTTP